MGGSDAAREARAVVEQANKKVDEAMQHLQASRPLYRMSEGPAPNPYSSNLPNSSSSSTSYPSSSSRPQQRFGSSGGSSSLMLAELRNSQAAVDKSSQGDRSRLNINNPSVSTNAPLGRVVHTEIEPEVRAHTNTSSMTGDISKRLGILFANSINSNRGRDTGLNTDYILHNFRDLGDQYAAMFKDTLHSVAVLKDGKWYRR